MPRPLRSTGGSCLLRLFWPCGLRGRRGGRRIPHCVLVRRRGSPRRGRSASWSRATARSQSGWGYIRASHSSDIRGTSALMSTWPRESWRRRTAARSCCRKPRARCSTIALQFRTLGWHQVKDVAEPLSLYQLGDGEFPSLRALPHTNLPRQPTPFLGRGRELTDVVTLSSRARTWKALDAHRARRFGQDAARTGGRRRLSRTYPYGVAFVSLAPVRAAELVVPTVSEALGGGEDLAAAIGNKRLLLVLDNLEQVIAAASELAALLAAW